MNNFIVGEKQSFGEMDLKESKQVHWAAIKKDEDCESSSIKNHDQILASPSSSASFSSSSSCLSSSELADDASSSSLSCNSNSSSSSTGPLYELADLMAQLPIKRGLSKFYNGKSQTFASLSNVRSVEDLAKKEMSCGRTRRMKSCKSYGGNLNHHNKFGPKATIAKRSPKTLCSPSSFGTKGAMVMHV